jgi:hypothetical protein
MGIAQSFLAVKGKAPDEIHRTLGLTDTGVVAGEWDYPRPEVRGAALPGGWYLVLLKDVDHRFVRSDEILKLLSQGCEVVGSQIEEHCMFSSAFGFSDGAFRWKVAHDPDEGEHHLEVEGTPPAAFDEIAARMRAEQAEEDAKEQERPELLSVDFIWEIPIELAKSFCRYRHDEDADWGKPEFRILEEGKT